jgi:MazG family protein
LPPASAVIYIGCLMPSTGERFERAVAIMERLRAPGGCPWDREQTFDSIKPYTLEETYEVLEAIDNRDWPELAGELGDLMLQVLFYAEMAKEQASFSIDDVLDRLSAKLINRHPHVFGDVKADTSAEVKRNWEAIKIEERKLEEAKKRQAGIAESDAAPAIAAKKNEMRSILAGVSSAMPSLLEAYKLSSRAAQAGFDWPNVEGLFDKLNEETSELREQLQEFPAPGPRPQGRGMAGSGRTAVPEGLQARLEDEVGDLFFVLVNIARYLSLDPESALRKTNRKFKRRFQWMEARLHESGRTPDQAPMEELESLWQQAKTEERREEKREEKPA